MDFEKYIEINEKEMIEALQKVLRAKSEEAAPVKTADGEVYPFGEGVQEALVKTLEIGKNIFQSSFHDHIVRNQKEYRQIWQYINDNPINWNKDIYFS